MVAPRASPPASLGAGAFRAPPGIAEIVALDGKPMYLALCRQCHGADARGYAADHAPSLVNPTFLDSASDDFLRRSIVAGRPGTSMAAYGKARGGPLDDAAVDRLVQFLRGQGRPPRALPATTAGDPAVGAAIYAKRCFSCHGSAQLRGEAVSLVNVGFLADATDAFLRHAIAHGRPGTKMEPFAGALSDAEIDGVVSYLRAQAGPPPPEMLPEPTGKEPLVLNPSGKPPHFTLRADPCPPLPPGVKESCKPDPRFVSVDQVAAAVRARQRVVIVDARPSSDWRRVHIAGAVSIPYLDMKRLDELAGDGTWVVAYCACPHHLSGIVVDELRRRGYTHSAVLDEGINEWHRRGLPVVAAPGVTPPPQELIPHR
jgi:mono/diheme cytochrome c family protein/rhodanese-related sulfurtransferase